MSYIETFFGKKSVSMLIQWNPAIPATLGTNKSGWISEVAGLVRQLDLRVSFNVQLFTGLTRVPELWLQ